VDLQGASAHVTPRTWLLLRQQRMRREAAVSPPRAKNIQHTVRRTELSLAIQGYLAGLKRLIRQSSSAGQTSRSARSRCLIPLPAEPVARSARHRRAALHLELIAWHRY